MTNIGPAMRIGETYEYTIPGYETVWWNISRAKWEVRDPANVEVTVPIERDQMQAIADRNDFDPDHLATVDETQPGIGAPIFIEDEVAYILIDGTHRCVKALRADRPFYAQLLTHAANERCLLRGDLRLRVPR